MNVHELAWMDFFVFCTMRLRQLRSPQMWKQSWKRRHKCDHALWCIWVYFSLAGKVLERDCGKDVIGVTDLASEWKAKWFIGQPINRRERLTRPEPDFLFPREQHCRGLLCNNKSYWWCLTMWSMFGCSYLLLHLHALQHWNLSSRPFSRRKGYVRVRWRWMFRETAHFSFAVQDRPESVCDLLSALSFLSSLFSLFVSVPVWTYVLAFRCLFVQCAINTHRTHTPTHARAQNQQWRGTYRAIRQTRVACGYNPGSCLLEWTATATIGSHWATIAVDRSGSFLYG